METIEKIKERVRKNIKKLPYKEEPKGGQSCGVIYTGIRLFSEELGAEVMIDFSRSQLKNYDYAMTIMNLIIDDQIN